ncbi:MAG TPA: exonuclease SbcCD subunit D C-terminal domain-containing protein, partial [Paludibacter sp.]
INSEQIDIVIVAGDVFDTTTPSNRSQELYYQFLYNASTTCCRHIVITGGNHDSPTFLNAPKQLLKVMDVHVVGEMCENIADEVITLYDKQHIPEAIICAVPFLRDRDVRTVEAGETMDDKSLKVIHGIAKHYEEVANIALEKQKTMGAIPIIGVGHLFTSGGKTTDGDGVRELYVGTLAHVAEDFFPSSFDYLALGHLHIAQTVGNANNKRYSGSPIPMGFNEAKQTKKIVVVEFTNNETNITEHEVPRFQELHKISGSADEIKEKLTYLKAQNTSAWLEVELTGKTFVGDLIGMVNEAIKDSNLIALLIKNKQIELQVLSRANETETLEELDPNDVFLRCLSANDISDENNRDLLLCYNEILNEIDVTDYNAE